MHHKNVLNPISGSQGQTAGSQMYFICIHAYKDVKKGNKNSVCVQGRRSIPKEVQTPVLDYAYGRSDWVRITKRWFEIY